MKIAKKEKDLTSEQRERLAKLLFLLGRYIQVYCNDKYIEERDFRLREIAPVLSALPSAFGLVEHIKSIIQKATPYPYESKKTHQDRLRRASNLTNDYYSSLIQIPDVLFLFMEPDIAQTFYPEITSNQHKAGKDRVRVASTLKYKEQQELIPTRWISEIYKLLFGLKYKWHSISEILRDFIDSEIFNEERKNFFSLEESALRARVTKYRKSKYNFEIHNNALDRILSAQGW